MMLKSHDLISNHSDGVGPKSTLGLGWLVTSLKPTSILYHVFKTCLKCIPQMGVKFLP